MATPNPDDVAAFMRITGASEFVAVQKLEEFGGNLSEAVNAHFIERDSHIHRENFTAAPQYNYTNENYQNRMASHGGILPFLSAARRFRPSLLLDRNYRRELRDLYNGIGATAFTGHAPHTSQPGEVREVPAGIHSAFELPHQSRLSSTSAGFQNDYSLAQSNTSHVPDDYIEEEMIQAAIEASRKQFGALNGSSDGGLPQSHFQQEDDDLAHAISLSLKTAEQEKAIREHLVEEKKERPEVHDLLAMGEKTNSNRSRLELGTSSNQNVAQDDAQSVMGHPLNCSAGGHLQGNEDVFISNEWGCISSDELNEAVVLETALFGEIPNHSSHNFSSLPDLQHHLEKNMDPKLHCLSSPTSQSLTDTWLLREQQDADYLASLPADKRKELNALKEAETRCTKEEEPLKKMLENKELEKMLDKKEVMLSKEPSLDDENAIAIVVRMPDGSRHERHFLKTDKLQLLFDFIDICGALKPGTYRVVKSFPRRAYSINDSSSTLNEVGLSSKNEALFLELV